MTCPTCLDNCDPLVTDKCTKYTGPTIDILGVCNGMSLFEVEAIILAKLQSVTDTTTVSYSTLTTTCSFIVSLLSTRTQPLTLQQFAEMVLDGFCRIDARLTNVTPTPFSFITTCLTGDVSSRDKILQATINKSCSLDGRITTIEGDFVKQSDLCAQITACLPSIPPVTPTSTQYNTRMVPGVVYPYIGSISNFDNTGKGLSSAGFDKIYLVNGVNGTTDWRGRSPIGAIRNVPGGTLDNAVDPSISVNTPYNYSLNDKLGKSSVALALSESPSHSHTLNDPGHRHKISGGSAGTGSYLSTSHADGGNLGYSFANSPTDPNAFDSSLATTNITIGSTGGSAAHTNLHPVVACLYIIYIP